MHDTKKIYSYDWLDFSSIVHLAYFVSDVFKPFKFIKVAFNFLVLISNLIWDMYPFVMILIKCDVW